MNFLKALRKPKLTLFLALSFLIFSCTKYDNLENDNYNFDYKTFENFKSTHHTIDFSGVTNNQKTEIDIIRTNRALLNIINNELGTELNYPDLILKSLTYSAQELIEISLTESWINQKQVHLLETFSLDLQNKNFDFAIQQMEQNINSLNLNNEEFEQINLFANNLKSLNYKNPNLFSFDNRSGWRCALAIIALAAATAGLGSCATGVACALAVTLHINAMYSVADHCGGIQ